MVLENNRTPEIVAAIAYFEEAVRESDEIISACSPALRAELEEQRRLSGVAGMANFDCCGCKNELESRDTYPCNCCLRNEVSFADNYEEESPQREEGRDDQT